MNKAIKYILSIFNPNGKDGRLDFLIKGIIGLIIGIIITYLLNFIIIGIMILLNQGKIQTSIILLLPLIISIIVIGGIQVIVTIRRFRDLGQSPYLVILYLFTIFIGIGILRWLYLLLEKGKNTKN